MEELEDPALQKALERWFKHSPPFSRDELGSVEDLHVRHARSLSGLHRCSNLQLLIAVGCDAAIDLTDVIRLERLTCLIVRDSGLNTLDALDDRPWITALSCYTPRNRITDATPLTRIPRLQDADLTGNPLSEHSYRKVVPALRERGTRVLVSGELEWKVTHHLHEHGIPVSCYKKMGASAFTLCRPGLELSDAPEYGHVDLQEKEVRALLNGNPENVFRFFSEEIESGRGSARRGP
ncbi:hypothetical protein [Streptomyces anulatus]|uniref:hypothetical protein n=1 Tax=Streptomyces anulatus TaxID=1892 RepID=UPI001C26BC51|nr:hypothetical protein [Streptomyces anulatus]